ncbi:putative reverse transcriptase domain-containing protein [Tanacetum coccineum]
MNAEIQYDGQLSMGPPWSDLPHGCKALGSTGLLEMVTLMKNLYGANLKVNLVDAIHLSTWTNAKILLTLSSADAPWSINVCELECYCDAGFETDRDDTKSQTGYVFVLNGGAVDWKSSKQSTTAMSATESEYIAASDSCMEAVWQSCLHPQSPAHLSTLILSQGVFWGADEELSDGGLEHPPSLNYVPGPEHPPSPVKPLPADALPTALSPSYVADSGLDEDPEEDPEENHADYPADGGDGDDEPFNDDDDDNDTDDDDEEAFEDEDNDEEEEEHLAPTDSSDVPVVDLVPSAGDTEAFETGESAPTPKSP